MNGPARARGTEPPRPVETMFPPPEILPIPGMATMEHPIRSLETTMLNTTSAITFNKQCGYSTAAIGAMQKLVKVPRTSTWDAVTVKAVHDYQACANGAGSPDGKVGGKTLGCFVRDTYKLGGTQVDLIELQKYPYVQAPANTFKEVVSFKPRIFAVKAENAMHGSERRWKVSWMFELDLDLNRQIHPTKIGCYEYRQYIRGGVWWRYGLEGFWSPTWYNANEKGAFKIPAYVPPTPGSGLPATGAGPGLHESIWKEDGIVRNGDERYGYRSSIPMNHPGERDQWVDAYTYRLRDTPSIGDTSPTRGLADAVEVWFELYFTGYVIELGMDPANRFVPRRIVASESWKCHQSNIRLALT